MRIVAIALLLTLSMTACGSDESKTDGAKSAGPVEPASGQAISIVDGTRFRLTADDEWDVLDQELVVLGSADVEGGSVEVLAASGTETSEDLDKRAKSEIVATMENGDCTVKRKKDRTVNGQLGFVLEGRGEGVRCYVFGTLIGYDAPTISFTFWGDIDDDKWIEPILTSAEWNS